MKASKIRPIIEIIEQEAPTLDLIKHDGDRPYYTAKCPFHDDKNPSFIVYEGTQRWSCFSCDPDGGTVIDFVMRYNKISFEEAYAKCTEELEGADAIVFRLQTHIKQSMGKKAINAFTLVSRAKKAITNKKEKRQFLNDVVEAYFENEVSKIETLLNG